MKRVQLEVIAPTLQGLGLCSTCELVLSHGQVRSSATEQATDEYPLEWRQDHQRLVEYVQELAQRYGEGILIRVIDPQSPEGLLKSMRYRVRRYPTWVVEGRTRVVGWDRQALEAALAQLWEEDRTTLPIGRSAGRHVQAEAEARGAANPKDLLTRWLGKARGLARMLADMLYGATIYDMVRELNKERGMLERLFVLAVFGDLLGVPILPPYYALRLLPYVTPQIRTWRTTMMRERDLTDLFDQEIG